MTPTAAIVAAALSVCSRHTQDTDQAFIDKCRELQAQSASHDAQAAQTNEKFQQLYDMSIIDRALKELGK